MRSIPMRAVNQPAEQETSYQLRSPLLFGVLQSMDPDKRLNVLDLSPANPSLIDHFSDCHCKLFLPGCEDALLTQEVDEEDDDISLLQKTERILKLPENTAAFDLILLWDLPNYLDKRLLQSLMKILSRYANKDSVLHSYIHTRQTIPNSPASFRFTPEQNVIVDITAPWTATCPAYHQALLNKIMSPFMVNRGMLLANGFQEYILRIKCVSSNSIAIG